MPFSDDRSGDVYVPTKTDCNEPGFNFATFDFTVYGAVLGNRKSSAVLVASCKNLNTAAIDAEETKTAVFPEREQEVVLVPKTDEGIIWKCDFQFRPFS